MKERGRMGLACANGRLFATPFSRERCRICSGSAGLVPVAGTIGWLTHAQHRYETFSAGLVPVESTIRLAHGGVAIPSCARPGQARYGAKLLAVSPISQSITARRGQAPIVAEQNQH